jgi:hypothetical protein
LTTELPTDIIAVFYLVDAEASHQILLRRKELEVRWQGIYNDDSSLTIA